jgi:antitoxin VapB
LSGDTLTGAVKVALREKLERDMRASTAAERYERLMALSKRSAARIGPVTMSPEDAIGYDENGLPT